ncbi:hypothetical protein BKA70DRAFT_1242496 [Coprinopsis sp. MPI-PUGE-AT-0042]|nr:hypothetical protein BKA70DRAFT_1242496 [Coprinopsis sp. MPI-PUGE-AT-0042]
MSSTKDSSRPVKFHRRIQPGLGPRLIKAGPNRARVIEAEAAEVSDGDENMGEGSSSRASTESSMSTGSSSSSSNGATITGVYSTIEHYPIHKQFRRLMRQYAEDKGLEPSDKWVYYGDVVQPEDTPASLGMEEDPLPRIEVVIYRKITFPDPFSFSSEVKVLVCCLKYGV